MYYRDENRLYFRQRGRYRMVFTDRDIAWGVTESSGVVQQVQVGDLPPIQVWRLEDVDEYRATISAPIPVGFEFEDAKTKEQAVVALANKVIAQQNDG